MKLAILPKKIPIGADRATKSKNINELVLCFFEINISTIIILTSV